jgi:hypothetical protein
VTSHRGIPVTTVHRLRPAIALHHSGSAGTKSGGEDAFLAPVEDFPEPLVNLGPAGFERDFHWPDLRLAVEIGGSGHGRPRSRAEDDRRDQTLLEAGYALLRFSGETVYRCPRAVLAEPVGSGLRECQR